ncbi:motility associated factor glycosyltransferase family protein [Butyrivibrio sp. INlla16]|uniref:motility associated factor glycosyltransferase family protein n=1 Tax=Butyrivibrio sp. INlla16 TaxID=1520807 RepID=UPI00088038D3|nr:6-hydroxymethylpterin diphosphokinase MptE-like protein [Butyrivibrio sp. INlla16]SDB60061.1 Uncharacterized conserved protein [Butyrivibrio sp. INlla16]
MVIEGGIIRECRVDETLRANNFNAFEERYGLRPQIDPNESKKYRMTLAQNGEFVLEIIGASPFGDLRMNSSYSPSYEAIRWADRLNVINRRTSILLLGFSTGVYLWALMRKLRPDTTFYVFEPEEGLFSFVCAHIDLSEEIRNNRIRLYITESQRKRIDYDMLWEISTYRPEISAIETPFYASNERFKSICSALEKNASSMRSFQRVHGRRTLSCRMYAWNHMQQAASIIDLEKRIPKDIPVVIVASGPSLRKNVEILKKIKGHALIICCDRSVKLLDEHGIEPDIITSLDTEKDPEFLRGKVTENVSLLCSYQLNDVTQREYLGRSIYYYALKHERMLFGDKVDNGNGFDHGGNIAGSSFSLCRVMGIKTIILIGQDLAYLNGESHAVGEDKDIESIQDVEIEGMDGRPIMSNIMWVKFRDFYERQIRLYPELRVINATEGGAMIHGSEVMTLSEVADNVCKKAYDVKGIFNNLPSVQTREEYKETLKKLSEWLEELDFVAAASEELSDVCRQLLNICKFKDITDPHNENKLQKMDELRKRIIASPVNSLLEDYWIEDIYSIPDATMVLRNNEEAIPVFEDAITYYTRLPDDCMSLKEELVRRINEGKADYKMN